MSIFNSAPHIASRLASLEVIDENDNVVAEYGPYENGMTDGYVFTNRDMGYGRISYGVSIGLFAGCRYPLKYRGPSTATVVGGVLVAPGLLADYGVDTGGSGYINAPSLTGKVVKFDTGEEYYISGVNGGNIILRNGGRIKTSEDHQSGGGGFYSASQWSWFFPQVTGDIVSPVGYTIWDVGDFSAASSYTPQSAAYGENFGAYLSSTIAKSAVYYPTRTGVYGIYTGKIVATNKYESTAFGANFNIGKVSINCGRSESFNSLFDMPFAHVNVGGTSGIQILSGQKVRAAYETVFDMTPMFDSFTGDFRNTPIFSGIPNSSGYFVPTKNLQGTNMLSTAYNGSLYWGGSNNAVPMISETFNHPDGQVWAIFDNATFNIVGSGATQFPPSHIANITGCLDRSYSRANGGFSSVNRVAPTNPTGTRIFTGGSLVTTRQNFYATINDWNGSITGLYFTDIGAFIFSKPFVKDPAYELAFSMTVNPFKRQLIN